MTYINRRLPSAIEQVFINEVARVALSNPSIAEVVCAEMDINSSEMAEILTKLNSEMGDPSR
jgi:hypothetical protein